MEVSIGVVGSSCVSSSSSWLMGRKKAVNGRRGGGGGARCAAATRSLYDQYRTLGIQPGALEKEVKSAFRKLALQYHPDVCKGSNCGVQFHRINEAYDIVMNALRESDEEQEPWQSSECADDEPMRGMCDPTWDLWEEWMGWEGAGIRDYSSHINPYI